MTNMPDAAADSEIREIKPAGQPTISVALCTYHGAPYIRAQLLSIFSQTDSPDEIVVRDDGSTDSTVAILHELAKQSPCPSRILPPGPPLGVAGNFFTCARACRSEWILFADQDDYWLPERLALFRRSIQEHPDCVAVLSDGTLADSELKPLPSSLWHSYYFSRREQRQVEAGQAEQVLTRHVFVTGAALAVRRDFLASLPEPAAEFYHDEWIGWFAGNQLALLRQKTFLYRQHQAQQTGVQTTLRGKWRHFLQTQDQSRALLARDVQRYPALARALADCGLTSRAERVLAKVQFIQWRLNLSRHGPVRLIQVLCRLIRGDYHRYALWHHSLLKDLIFPASLSGNH
jgi:glycosyltransferase involved in cell wall biosynthesis